MRENESCDVQKLGELATKIRALRDDDVLTMDWMLPTKYHNIVGRNSELVIGRTPDPNDVLVEEPGSTFVEISEEEFYRDDD